MNQHNWIITDDVAGAVSFADMYRLGRPVNSNLIFPREEDNVRKDTGLLECTKHIAVITPVPPMNEVGLHISVEGYQRTLYAMSEWHTGDRGFARKVGNVILILNGVATYLKRPYSQPKPDPMGSKAWTDSAVFTFQKVMEKRASERQQMVDMLMQPIISSQALRG